MRGFSPDVIDAVSVHTIIVVAVVVGACLIGRGLRRR
jgi:hypothetical protein